MSDVNTHHFPHGDILVVDDNTSDLKYLSSILREAGYTVRPASDGELALRSVRAKLPALILLDIKMPGLDGYEVCRRLKAAEDTRGIPVIFISAKTSPLDKVKAFGCGGVDYISKPFDPQEVLARVATHLALWKAQKEIEEKNLQLQQEIAERKQAEERMEHLNLVLRAIRSVNQLIARERDRDRLLQGACDRLIETRGYYNAWIALLDEAGGLVTTAEAGLGEDFLPMVEQLKRGELTACGQKALTQPGVVVTEDPVFTCTDCSLADKYGGRGAMTVRLEHGGKVYGLLSASIPAHLTADEEEQSLFEEVARDIALALHSIELEEERKRAEEALRESEELHRTLVDTLPDAVAMFDLQGQFIYASPLAPELFGVESVEDLIETNGLRFIAPEEKELALKNLTAAADEEIQRGKEYSVVRGDGTRFSAELNVSTLGDIDGKAKAFIIVIRDITERKRAEEALRESEEHYRTIFESAPVGIFHSTPEGKMTSANPAMSRFFGYESPDELMAVVNRSSVAEALYVHPQKRPPPVDMALEQEGWGVFENQYRRKDGEVITGNVLFRAVRNPDGTISRLEGFIEDITERKRGEEALRESEERIHTVVSNAPIVMWALDKEGVFILSEGLGLEVLGLRPGEVEGQSVFDMYRDLPQVLEDNRRALAGESFVSIVEVGELVFESHYSPLRDKSGEVIGMIGVSTDITERKRAEEALREKMEEVERINRLFSGREQRMIELKREVNSLLEKLGQAPRYDSPAQVDKLRKESEEKTGQ